MGFFTNIKNNIENSYREKKAAAEADRAYVDGNIGSEAIAEFLAAYFEKGAPLYNWVKQNRTPVNFLIEDDKVRVYYDYSVRNPQSFKEAMPKKEFIADFSFAEIYSWYGCSNQGAFSRLVSKVQVRELEGIISRRLDEMQHLKYTTGWTVKLFA